MRSSIGIRCSSMRFVCLVTYLLFLGILGYDFYPLVVLEENLSLWQFAWFWLVCFLHLISLSFFQYAYYQLTFHTWPGFSEAATGTIRLVFSKIGCGLSFLLVFFIGSLFKSLVEGSWFNFIWGSLLVVSGFIYSTKAMLILPLMEDPFLQSPYECVSEIRYQWNEQAWTLILLRFQGLAYRLRGCFKLGLSLERKTVRSLS